MDVAHHVLLDSKFRSWFARVGSDPNYTLKKVMVETVDMFGPNKVGFIKLKADIRDHADRVVPGIAVLRGNSVCIFVVLECEEDGCLYVVLTAQPRVAAGDMALLEIPAGMTDDNGDIRLVATAELREELDLAIDPTRLIRMTRPGRPLFLSPGLLDERMHIYAYHASISRQKLDAMNGKLTGNEEENERICLKIVPLDDLENAIDDMKVCPAHQLIFHFSFLISYLQTLTALYMYTSRHQMSNIK
jgi:ADP-sugar diphosphatase